MEIAEFEALSLISNATVDEEREADYSENAAYCKPSGGNTAIGDGAGASMLGLSRVETRD